MAGLLREPYFAEMNPRDAAPAEIGYPKPWRYRTLIGVAVASPIVVGGAAAVLVAHALGHSWLWGWSASLWSSDYSDSLASR